MRALGLIRCWKWILGIVALASWTTLPAHAHDVIPGYLQLRQTQPDTYELLWRFTAFGEVRPQATLQLPSDCVDVVPRRAEFSDNRFTEHRTIRRPGGLNGCTIHVDGLASAGTEVVVRVERLDGSTQIARLTSGSASLVVSGAPDSLSVWWTYLRLGFEHILLGVDHLLFVLGLLLIVHDRWMLLKTITAFTVAHSLTLAMATLGYAHAPLPPLNAAIALSILFLGPEIVRSWRGETSLTLQKPWIVAFAFGLLHGFGFASGLSTAGMPARAIPEALLCFNLGVEFGQLTFVGIVLALEKSFSALHMHWPRWIARAPGYAVGIFGAFWTIQRTVMMFGTVGQ